MSQFACIRVSGVAAALLLAMPAAAVVPADIEARVQEIVDEEVAGAATPGAAVAVVADGRLVASVASGLADRETGRRVTRQTIFPAASVSKLLTATLVMRQVERGNLELDRAANDYLPPDRWIRDAELHPVGATLRQLLSHASGLPVAFSRAAEVKPDGSARSLSEYLAGGLRTIRAPGERLIYSNEAFALAGYLAAEAEGEEFEVHAQRVLLGPLGMSDSSFFAPREMPSRLTALHGTFFDDAARTEEIDLSPVGPAGSLHTTADDLARFALLHLGEGSVAGVRVLAPGSVHEMMRLQARQHPKLPDGFGLGFAVLGAPERRMVWWDGSVPGAASRLALLPDRGIGVAILTNLSNPLLVDTISRRIFDLMAGPVERPETVADDTPPDVTGEYRLVDVLEPSTWYMNPLLLVSVERRDDQLEIGIPFTDAALPLEARGLGRYRLSGIVDGVTVLFEDDRLYALFIEGRRVSAFETSTALLIYAGAVIVFALAAIGWGVLRVARRVRPRRAAAGS